MFSQAHHCISNLLLWAKRVIMAMPSFQIALPPLHHRLLKPLLRTAREGICHHHRWHRKWTSILLLGLLSLHDKALLNLSPNFLQKLIRGSTHTHLCTEMDHHYWRMPILPDFLCTGVYSFLAPNPLLAMDALNMPALRSSNENSKH